MQSGIRNKVNIQINEFNNLHDIVWRYLFPLIAFLSIMVQSRLMTIIIAFVFIAFSIGKSPITKLRGRIMPLTIFVIIYSMLSLLAGLYSDFGDSAVKGSARILSAFALFSLVLVGAKRDSEKHALTIIAVISAIISFLCIDASCLKLFTKIYCTIVKLFLYDCDIESMGYEQGVRITGIFCNPNVSAGIIAFGILISLFLILNADTKRNRFLAFNILGINALGFFLSFSMGAIVAFTFACIMYIIAIGKGKRFPIFLLMIGTIFSTAAVSLIAIPFLGTSGIRSIVPLLCALICGPLLWTLDNYVAQRLINKVNVNSKIIGTISGILFAVIAGYLILSFNITSGISLSSSDKISRAEYLKSGEYSASAESNGAIELLVYSQDEAQLMMHTNNVLYTGSPDDAKFTVPDDSRVVWFVITAQENVRLNKITLTDGTTLKLNYPLLPTIAANRLQGLFANQNFIQRLVFFEDGIKLFKQSPIIGNGLGAVEGRLTSVQSFYYESVYIHNHFIQVMDEMGLVGLLVFVLMLLSAAYTLWKERKKHHEPVMFAALAACMVMMIAHSLTEVVWSTGMYQTVGLLIFATIIIMCDDGSKTPLPKTTGRFFPVILFAIILCFGTMISGNLIALNKTTKFQPNSREEVVSTMRKLDLMDVYDDEFYKATYIQNALLGGNIEEQMIATKYAKQLRAADEYGACTDVAMYYYLPKGMIDAMFDASRAAIAQEASNPDAWNLQLDFYQQSLAYLSEKDMDKYIEGVMSTLDYLESYNKGRMEEIRITEQNKPFVDCVKQLAASGASKSEIFITLSEFSK